MPACHDGQVISYAASLRVYEPLRAFPEPERAQWTEYVEPGLAVDPVTGTAAEHAAGVAAVISLPPTGAPESRTELAFVRVHEGVPYVCPARTRLRSWQALSEFRASMPEVVAGAFVPLAVIENAENALEKWLAEHPDLRVARADRHATRCRCAGCCSSTRPSASWCSGRGSPIGDLPAEQRPPVRLRDDDGAGPAAGRPGAERRPPHHRGRPVVAGVEGVARWLEEFHPHSLVELDYGGLVHLFDDEELVDDESRRWWPGR